MVSLPGPQSGKVNMSDNGKNKNLFEEDQKVNGLMNIM